VGQIIAYIYVGKRSYALSIAESACKATTAREFWGPRKIMKNRHPEITFDSM